MNYNPYAAPQAPPPQQPPGQGGMPQPWEVGEVYGQAWEIFKKQWVVVVLSWFLVAILIGVPIQIVRVVFLPIPFGRVMGVDEMIALYRGMLPLYGVAFIFQAFFDVGLIRIQCAAARGETPSFATRYSGYVAIHPMQHAAKPPT